MAGFPPPPPTKAEPGSFAWMDWYRKLYNFLNEPLPWSQVSKVGSSLVDIQTKDHNLLTTRQGGNATESYHLTAAEYTGTGTGPFVRQDSAVLTGPVTFTGTLKPTVAGGYKSSDGSVGYTGTVTTALLVGKTITIKDGLIVSFA